MRVLYQFPLSHYSEKSRWTLDHKGLEYVAKNLWPGLHLRLTKRHTTGRTLPVLLDQGRYIGDSTQIAHYLDGLYPDKPLISAVPSEREAILQIDHLAGKLGNHVRRWMYSYVLDDPRTMRIMLGEQTSPRTVALVSPAMRWMVRTGYSITPEAAEISKQKQDDLLDQLEVILLAGNGQYLVGNRLSLADMATASLAAPLLAPHGTPWELGPEDDLPTELVDYMGGFSERPLGQYITRLYANDRQARVDWRGQ